MMPELESPGATRESTDHIGKILVIGGRSRSLIGLSTLGSRFGFARFWAAVAARRVAGTRADITLVSPRPVLEIRPRL